MIAGKINKLSAFASYLQVVGGHCWWFQHWPYESNTRWVGLVVLLANVPRIRVEQDTVAGFVIYETFRNKLIKAIYYSPFWTTSSLFLLALAIPTHHLQGNVVYRVQCAINKIIIIHLCGSE